ncbi:MAG TPA: helix-turn-helix domain-containing protein [Solirubrobacteraceae bacterium]|nr:helix-turn-helix domain-containing protein [Solirubrobacteraceae bacterium]
MRSYREYCAVAKALDVVGDRWTLLIVRELALRGACRYSDLQEGLPGISTNLLADRLRELEESEVVVRREPRPPVATPVFELTEHGRALEPVLRGLMGWGIRYLVEGPAPQDSFRGRWLSWPAEMFLADREPSAGPARVELEAEGEAIGLAVEGGRISVELAGEHAPDARLSGDPHAMLGLITGYLSLDDASGRGVSVEGSRALLERILPGGPPSGAR